MKKADRAAMIKAALAVGARWPVFPLNKKKRPVWSNAELGVARGGGGFHAATQEPDEIRRLFEHRDAFLIGVPTGAEHGLVVVDLDFYKSAAAAAWKEENEHRLPDTRTHKTMNGGEHNRHLSFTVHLAWVPHS